jgi:hypothetical protein
VQLRSPFNGEIWTVPPDQSPAFVEELIKRGFVRVESAAGSYKTTEGRATRKTAPTALKP